MWQRNSTCVSIPWVNVILRSGSIFRSMLGSSADQELGLVSSDPLPPSFVGVVVYETTVWYQGILEYNTVVTALSVCETWAPLWYHSLYSLVGYIYIAMACCVWERLPEQRTLVLFGCSSFCSCERINFQVKGTASYCAHTVYVQGETLVVHIARYQRVESASVSSSVAFIHVWEN